LSVKAEEKKRWANISEITKPFLTGAFYVGNGWENGGCWDDEIDSYCGSFPKIPY
jgi:hypothetical protein